MPSQRDKSPSWIFTVKNNDFRFGIALKNDKSGRVLLPLIDRNSRFFKTARGVKSVILLQVSMVSHVRVSAQEASAEISSSLEQRSNSNLLSDSNFSMPLREQTEFCVNQRFIRLLQSRNGFRSLWLKAPEC